MAKKKKSTPKKKSIKKEHIIIFSVVAVLLVIIVTFGMTYSLFQLTHESEKTYTVDTTCFNVSFAEETSSINLENAYPMSNDEGLETNPYTFTISNNDCEQYSTYILLIDIVDNSTTFDLEYIKLSLNGSKVIDPTIINTLQTSAEHESTIRTSYILDTKGLLKNESNSYDLRLWLADNAPISEMNGQIEARVRVITTAESKSVQEFAYTGEVQEYTVPKTGYYEVELWGAQGEGAQGGKGGYTKGTIYLEQNEVIYLYIGNREGYNGGGKPSSSTYYSGGGATDIRLASGTWSDTISLRSRIMVAGAGGGMGSNRDATWIGGLGGSLYGGNSTDPGYIDSALQAKGGTQNSGGIRGIYSTTNDGKDGSFGMGGNSSLVSSKPESGGGGSGYYGGGSGIVCLGTCSSPGGGGSSYISGYAGSNSIDASGVHTNNSIHYSGKHFINGKMEAGVNEGDGKAKISYISLTKPNKTNTKLNNVRYIKDCINASDKNATGNQWMELQVIKDGVNIAKGLTPIGTLANNASLPYTNATDGILTTYGAPADTTAIVCITLDLGQEYDVDEIGSWHFWLDGRKYNNSTLSIGTTNESGTTSLSNILHSFTIADAETSQGKRYNAWSLESVE